MTFLSEPTSTIYAVGWVERDRDNYDIFRHEDDFYATREKCQAKVDELNKKAKEWAAQGPGYWSGYTYSVEEFDLIT